MNHSTHKTLPCKYIKLLITDDECLFSMQVVTPVDNANILEALSFSLVLSFPVKCKLWALDDNKPMDNKK